MNLLRLVNTMIFVIGLSAGAVLAFTAGYFWPHEHQLTSKVDDDTRYRVTPHILMYYDVLRVDHIPEPEDYKRGMAGKDYCLNLAHWYVSIQYYITLGSSRGEIKTSFVPIMEFEVSHDWLTEEDKTYLLGFIVAAPVIGLPREKFGAEIRANCEYKRAKIEEIQV